MHLDPEQKPLHWKTDDYPHIYSMLESTLLERALRFKTNHVSPAEAISLIVSSAADFLGIRPDSLTKLMQQAIFRSYVCLLGKFTVSFDVYTQLLNSSKISFLLCARSEEQC